MEHVKMTNSVIGRWEKHYRILPVSKETNPIPPSIISLPSLSCNPWHLFTCTWLSSIQPWALGAECSSGFFLVKSKISRHPYCFKPPGSSLGTQNQRVHRQRSVTVGLRCPKGVTRSHTSMFWLCSSLGCFICRQALLARWMLADPIVMANLLQRPQASYCQPNTCPFPVELEDLQN
jgi:hypothetical protein